MLVLASNSATREKILKSVGVAFRQEGVDFDEDLVVAKNPKSFVYQATLGKFKVAVEKLGYKTPILVADTVVTAGGEILRKAKDEADAMRILSLQSGSTTSIITAMIYKSRKMELLDISATHYHFDKFDKSDLEKYISSGEWRGKAGACMVEGFCKKYIASVEGYESTAMGLCVEKLLPFLESW